MKIKNTILAGLLITTGLFVFSGQVFHAEGQNATPNQVLTPEQQAVQLKAKWTKTLTAAIQEFQSNNDKESADFMSGILTSLDRPDGMSPGALASNGQRMKDRVRALVRRGVLDSAATLNYAQWLLMTQSGFSKSGPPNPNNKTGGKPGPDGLVLYLPFDKPADADGAVHDESGTGNDGHAFGAQWVPDGKFGGAYQFHITNLTDRIVIPNSDTLNPDNITVAAWVKAADHDGFWNRIVDKDYRSSYCLDLGGDDNAKHRGKLEFETGRGSLSTARLVDDNKWHHVAGTYDGRQLRIYLDGTGSNPAVKQPNPMKKSAWDLCIGNSVVEDGTGEFRAFDGLIDEVRIYNRALSEAEIQALFTGTHAGADILASPVSVSPAGKSDAATRLKQVKALFDQGLINKDDYDKKVKEIMDSL